jgi:hypothetical protein
VGRQMKEPLAHSPPLPQMEVGQKTQVEVVGRRHDDFDVVSKSFV